MLNTPRFAQPLFLALLLLPIFPAQAQTMYRCGQSYQDRPCSAGTSAKIVSTGAPQHQSSPQASATVSNPICAQRGDQAKKIVWAREVGQTKDDQLSKANTPDQRLLIEEVYLTRGRADEVAAAIATKCVSDQERAELARALAAAVAGSSPAGAAASSPDVAKNTERQSEAKAARCRSIDDDLRVIQNQERAGGSAEIMDSLRKQKRSVEDNRQKEGC
jgi:hypothetical protein